ncbi:MAG: hypothetical protein CSB21_03805 [Deltaproteobacteria bacterium]|nr:MAG: hypothetical protein CSB21_03805 [Deltaproteobacteria bacterium]
MQYFNDEENSAGTDEKFSLKGSSQGEVMEVCDLIGGLGFKRKLASMGIMKGVTIEILSVSRGGQIIVSCLGSRYILGKSITEKIIVKKR